METPQQYLRATARLHETMAERCAAIEQAVAALVACFRAGGKVLLCGNGGSAADCQHVAAELVSQLDRRIQRPPLPAIALTTDTSFLTGYSNDHDFAGVFERQVVALGRPGDLLIAISTSGASANVLRAVRAARQLQMTTLGLTGEGGPLGAEVDHVVVVPSRDTQHVQEVLLSIEHLLCALVEAGLVATAG